MLTADIAHTSRSDSENKQHILIECPLLLELRSPQIRKLYRTSRELSASLRKNKQLSEIEEKLKSFSLDFSLKPNTTLQTLWDNSWTHNLDHQSVKVTSLHSSYLVEVLHNATIEQEGEDNALKLYQEPSKYVVL